MIGNQVLKGCSIKLSLLNPP